LQSNKSVVEDAIWKSLHPERYRAAIFIAEMLVFSLTAVRLKIAPPDFTSL